MTISFPVFSFSFLSFLPVAFICLVFYLVQKKKQQDSEKKVGRRNKDDLWHIIKEYLKMNDRHGLEIFEMTLYQRPEKKDLGSFLHKTERMLAKEFAKENNEKYIVPDKKKRYAIEDYFDLLEQESEKKLMSFKNSTIDIYDSVKTSRKRYVVCFRVRNNQTKEIFDWEAIEIELLKNPNNKTQMKYTVTFNKELNYQKELSWIYPMQKKYMDEQQEKERKRSKGKK